MSNHFLSNGLQLNTSFLQALEEVLRPAASIDLAVSYVKTLGWLHFVGVLQRIGMRPENVRLVVTDQFGITHPDALEKAMTAGASVRNYTGPGGYHPKVYLARASSDDPVGAIVGSANLSDSALTDGIEAGVIIAAA
jgi:HKD family nuclease